MPCFSHRVWDVFVNQIPCLRRALEHVKSMFHTSVAPPTIQPFDFYFHCSVWKFELNIFLNKAIINIARDYTSIYPFDLEY